MGAPHRQALLYEFGSSTINCHTQFRCSILTILKLATSSPGLSNTLTVPSRLPLSCDASCRRNASPEKFLYARNIQSTRPTGTGQITTSGRRYAHAELPSLIICSSTWIPATMPPSRSGKQSEALNASRSGKPYQKAPTADGVGQTTDRFKPHEMSHQTM